MPRRRAKLHIRLALEITAQTSVAAPAVGGAAGKKALLRASGLREVGKEGVGTAVHAARRPRAQRARSEPDQEVRAASIERRRLAIKRGREFRRGLAVLQGRAVPGLLGLRVAGAARPALGNALAARLTAGTQGSLFTIADFG